MADHITTVANMRLLKDCMHAAKTAKKTLMEAELAAKKAEQKLSEAMELVREMRAIYMLRESEAEAYLYARKQDPAKVNCEIIFVVQDIRAYVLLKYELEEEKKAGKPVPWVKLVNTFLVEIENIPEDFEQEALYHSLKMEKNDAHEA